MESGHAAPLGTGGPRPGQAQANEERNYAMWAHLSALAGLVVPLGNVLGPLIVWSISKDKGPFAAHHGKEALNFQLGVGIVAFALGVLLLFSILFAFLVIPLLFVVLAYLALAALAVVALVLAVVAALAANRGEWYRYPLAIRFIP